MERFVDIVGGFRFSDPGVLLLLPALAVFAGLKWAAARRWRPGVLFPAVAKLRRAGLTVNPVVAILPALLRWAALVAAVVALAGPRVPMPPSPLSSRGIDIMLALDVSESMRLRDFDGQSRFEAARDAARDFVETRSADRIGLLAFSGGSFTSCPLTLDHDMLERLIDSMAPGIIKEPGTAIGTAILTATNRLRYSESPEKVLVLLTDGENNVGEVGPSTAARLAAQRGIRIYTVFAGKPTSEAPDNGPSGPDAVAKAHAELLDVAASTGGRMFSADDPDAMARTFHDIDRLEKTRLSGHRLAHTVELYPWLLLAAGLFLAVEMACSSTRFLRIP